MTGSMGPELSLVNHVPSNGPWTHLGSPKDWDGTWIWSAVRSTRLLAVGALNSPCLPEGLGRDLDLVSSEVHQAVGSRGPELT